MILPTPFPEAIKAFLKDRMTSNCCYFWAKDIYPDEPGKAMLLSKNIMAFHRTGETLTLVDSVKVYTIKVYNPDSHVKKRFFVELQKDIFREER
jgi:hypothetical protein